MNLLSVILRPLKRKRDMMLIQNSDSYRISMEIKEVKDLIAAATNNFNYALDCDSIDYYTYLLKAYYVRYNKLVKELKCCVDSKHDYATSFPTKQMLVTEE